MLKKNITLKPFQRGGFTLLEILVFITLVSMVFLALSQLTITSIKNAKLSEHTVLATHAAQELQEWLRGEKEEDWNIFLTKAAVAPGLVYCVNSIPDSITDLTASAGCGTVYGIANTYKRDLTLIRNAENTQITASIVVTWMEGNNIQTVPVSTVFSIWE